MFSTKLSGRARRPEARPGQTRAQLGKATRMCDVVLHHRGAVCESMPNTGRKGEPMKSDTEIMDDVIDELRWDP